MSTATTLADPIIAKLKEHGFRVFQRNPTDSWLIYATQDGKKIAYCQFDRFLGGRIGTVHKPNHTTGTGYGVVTDPKWTLEELQQGFQFAPEWAAGGDRKTIVKYADIDAYRKESSFNAEYKEV